MKRPKKHIFKYLDPEKQKAEKIQTEKTSQKEQSQIVAERDLKRVVISIVLFVLLILLFIFLDNKFNFSSNFPLI